MRGLWINRDNIDIIYDELTGNKIDMDKQTLPFHIIGISDVAGNNVPRNFVDNA